MLPVLLKYEFSKIFFIYSLIAKPTRITSHTATLIDNIFTNNINNIDESINGIIFSDISDHLPIAYICNLDSIDDYNKQTINKSNYIRIINNENITSFTNEIRNLPWYNVLNNLNPENAFH
jgi:hypothetical protein